MQKELDIISLKDIMDTIRKSDISKIVLGTYFALPSFFDIKDGDIKITKPITIGEGYIKNIGNYTPQKISPVTGSIDKLINDSDYEQTLHSSSTSISFSCSKTTQVSAGLDIGKKLSISSNILLGNMSEEVSLVFHLNTTQSITETQTITRTIPSQSIKMPPRSVANVKAIMERMEFTGNVNVCVGLSRFEEGTARISKPKKKNVTYTIDMLSHVAPTNPTPFPYGRDKPVTFKELRKGHTDPVELWTTGKYQIEQATRLTVCIDITPIGSDKIINNYSIEL